MKSKKNYIYFLLFAVFMILVHVYIKPVFGDEIHFRAKLISYHYDILSLLKWRWMNGVRVLFSNFQCILWHRAFYFMEDH